MSSDSSVDVAVPRVPSPSQIAKARETRARKKAERIDRELSTALERTAITADLGTWRLHALERADAGEPLPPAESPPPRLLQRRVDALRIGARVRFLPQFVERLKKIGRDAWEFGQTEVQIGPYHFSAPRSDRRGVVVLNNADVGIEIDLKQHPRADTEKGRPVGWTVRVDARAMFLARHSPLAILCALEAVLEQLGEVEERRLRRIDLAADWSHWLLREEDAMSFKRPSGPSRAVEWVEVDESMTSARYHRGARLTGVTICPGGDLMMRLYSKSEQLRVLRKQETSDTEEELWTASGYRKEDGEVVRLEFQLRTHVLQEIRDFDACDPKAALEHLDAIWRYCTTKWCELYILERERDEERWSRRALDPRWCEAQAVEWNTHQSLPKRARKRDGASVEQFIGVALSIAAAAGEVVIENVERAVAGDVGAWQAMNPAARGIAIRREIGHVIELAKSLAVEGYLKNKGSDLEACEHWSHRKRAAVARHAKILAERTASAASAAA